MKKPIITIENLAEMIQRTMASKVDIKALRSEMNQTFGGVNSPLGKIENLLMEGQKQKLEH
jgi:hypothetical protein